MRINDFLEKSGLENMEQFFNVSGLSKSETKKERVRRIRLVNDFVEKGGAWMLRSMGTWNEDIFLNPPIPEPQPEVQLSRAELLLVKPWQDLTKKEKRELKRGLSKAKLANKKRHDLAERDKQKFVPEVEVIE